MKLSLLFAWSTVWAAATPESTLEGLLAELETFANDITGTKRALNLEEYLKVNESLEAISKKIKKSDLLKDDLSKSFAKSLLPPNLGDLKGAIEKVKKVEGLKKNALETLFDFKVARAIEKRVNGSQVFSSLNLVSALSKVYSVTKLIDLYFEFKADPDGKRKLVKKKAFPVEQIDAFGEGKRKLFLETLLEKITEELEFLKDTEPLVALILATANNIYNEIVLIRDIEAIKQFKGRETKKKSEHQLVDKLASQMTTIFEDYLSAIVDRRVNYLDASMSDDEEETLSLMVSCSKSVTNVNCSEHFGTTETYSARESMVMSKVSSGLKCYQKSLKELDNKGCPNVDDTMLLIKKLDRGLELIDLVKKSEKSFFDDFETALNPQTLILANAPSATESESTEKNSSYLILIRHLHLVDSLAKMKGSVKACDTTTSDYIKRLDWVRKLVNAFKQLSDFEERPLSYVAMLLKLKMTIFSERTDLQDKIDELSKEPLLQSIHPSGQFSRIGTRNLLWEICMGEIITAFSGVEWNTEIPMNQLVVTMSHIHEKKTMTKEDMRFFEHLTMNEYSVDQIKQNPNLDEGEFHKLIRELIVIIIKRYDNA